MGDMDSGNSGSIQSSSTGGGCGGGDDQEYDSRGGSGGGGDSISAFFNPMSSFNNINNMGSSSGSNPLQLYSFSNNESSSSFVAQHHQQQHQQVGVSNYFDQPPPTLSQSSSLECPNFMINHHINNNNNNNNGNNNNNNNNNNQNSNNQVDIVWPNKFASIRPSISTDNPNCTEGPVSYSITNNHQLQNPNPNPPPLPLPSPGQGHSQGPTAPVGSPRSSTAQTGTGSGRNSKKRSRASRRAPTTVLTTDTNNFRQMVQEFTGIPAPPFTSFSPRTRFDLFSGLGQSSSVPASAPAYLLRPFAQKVVPQPNHLQQQPPFLAHNTNSLNDILGLTTTTTTSNTTTTPTTALTNFELCDASRNDYLNPNPNPNPNPLSFQSLLQPTSSVLPALVHQDSNSTAQTTCPVNPVVASGNYLAFSPSTPTTATTAVVTTNVGSDNINGCTTTTKGEGMVDSWICSSD